MRLDELESTVFASDEARYAAILEWGCSRFGMDTGIISEIEEGSYTVIGLKTPPEFDVLSVGMEFPVEDTYCAKICETSDVVTYHHVGADPEMNLHPVYQAFQLESYIGAPLRDGDRIKGTLNFSSPRIHTDGFNDEDVADIRRLAALV